MTSFSRRARHLCLILPVLLLTGTVAEARAPARRAATAAKPAPKAPVPWLYRGSDVPQDKEWIFGELPNGLRYAVRRNGVPPGQVSIRVLVDAGSLYETDSQRGFAHLIEHLTFRDSKYLKSGEAVPTWQRLGATFGSDTNAETTATQTVYKLDIPEATPPKLDETFRLLSGMITAPIFTPQGVKTEVPIVLAEMRERSGAQARALDGTRELFFKGQLLAARSPIGTVETLQAATSESVKAFHDKWYRPDNAVIVVAGDCRSPGADRGDHPVVRSVEGYRSQAGAARFRQAGGARRRRSEEPGGRCARAGGAGPAAHLQLRHPAPVGEGKRHHPL